MDKKQVIIVDSQDHIIRLIIHNLKQSPIQIVQGDIVPIPIVKQEILSIDTIDEFTNNRTARRGNKNHKAWEGKRYYKK